jgi:PAS domain S-box-containing protein
MEQWEAGERIELTHAEEALRRSEAYLAEAQKLSHTGSFGWDVSSGEIYWSRETFRIFGFEPAAKITTELIVQRTHPEDRPAVRQFIDRASREMGAFDFEHRLLMPDGSVKYVRVVGHPSKNKSGSLEFVGAVTDITEQKRGELLLRESEQRFRAIFNEAGTGITLVDLASGGPIENNRALQTMLGCSRDELSHLETYVELTREEDREADAILFSELCNGIRETLRQEKHLILRDGRSVWANVIFTLLRDPEGHPKYVIAIHEDITERKRSEAALQESEERFRLIVDSIPGFICILTATGELESANRQLLEYRGKTLEELKGWATSDAIHPDDLPSVYAAWRRMIETGHPHEYEHRIRRADGVYRWFHTPTVPLRDMEGRIIRWYALLTDIDDRKKAEEELRRSEAYLAEAQKLSHTGSFGCRPSTGEMSWSEETFRIFGYDRAASPAVERILQRVHPEDRATVREKIDFSIREGKDCDMEYRLLLPDDSVKHVRVVAHASKKDESGTFEFVGAVMDITAAKQAEEKLRRSEADLLEAQRLAHTGSWSWNVRTRDAHWSQEMFRILGFDPEKMKPALSHFLERVHPEDRPVVEQIVKQEATGSNVDVVSDYRIVLPDRTIKHLHAIAHPLTNGSGEVVEVIGTSIDVTEQVEARNKLEKAFAEIKLLKDRLYKENIALREEIDKASMFEEIVGESPALQAVLARVAKVAPTESTVLITGETGTGKELIARAIHKQSRRSSRAFVTVNCAATPATLIASELFGHEKGAFTGAQLRRLGRFELAEGGTIFLDEIGELPVETQIALLRVLQEREFERVGGSQVIHADVRVIAATNRDLESAIAGGAFRKDLFYRLNVFPIEIPPLRERREDIPTLIEYFVHRYSRKAGKKIRTIEKKTLELLVSYAWPGNIRELQNVIERSVIVCETDVFSVDPSWLCFESSSLPQGGGSIAKMSAAQVREAIEMALTASGGRVSGPSGAATQLSMPASTLESKIRSLKINKYRFKSV